MQYTEAQRLTLKSFVQNDATLGPKFTAGDYDFVANALSAAASGPFVVWRSTTPLSAIFSAITLASFTPNDNPPASGSTVQISNDQLLYQNRALQCQLKQANLQILLLNPGGTIVSAKPNYRQALNDSLTSIPSGASGAAVDAGWAGAGGVRQAMQRSATLAEKQLATGTGTSGTPADLGVVDATSNLYAEGTVQAGDIARIML